VIRGLTTRAIILERERLQIRR